MVLLLLEKEELQRLQKRWWYDKGECVVESENKVSRSSLSLRWAGIQHSFSYTG